MGKIDFSKGSTLEIGRAFAKKSWNRKFTILSIPTGHGKTAISCVSTGIIRNGLQSTLGFNEAINVYIVCPKAKMEDGSWESTIEQYNEAYGDSLNILGIVTPTRLGNAKRDEVEFNKYSKKDLKIMAERYEENELIKKERRKIRRKAKKEKREVDESELPELLYGVKRFDNKVMLSDIIKTLDEKPTILIIDEVHYFKNPTSQRSQALNTILKKAMNTMGLGLTATPMANGKVEDGVAYLVFNQYYNSKNEFEKKHIPKQFKDKFYKPDVYSLDGSIDRNRFIDVDLFEGRLKDTIFVPRVQIDFPLPDQEMFLHSYSVSGRTSLDLKEKALAYKKRKYKSYIQYLSDVRAEIGSDIQHKRELAKVLTYYKKQGKEQPLIYYSTNSELESILFTLEQMGMDYSLLNGQNGYSKINKENLDQVIVIQYKAGGSAIEFEKSRLSIYYGLQHSWIDMEQAQGRNVRREETGLVTHILMLSDNPFDVEVYKNLQRKKKFTEEVYEELAETVANYYGNQKD